MLYQSHNLCYATDSFLYPLNENIRIRGFQGVQRKASVTKWVKVTEILKAYICESEFLFLERLEHIFLMDQKLSSTRLEIVMFFPRNVLIYYLELTGSFTSKYSKVYFQKKFAQARNSSLDATFHAISATEKIIDMCKFEANSTMWFENRISQLRFIILISTFKCQSA